ncbi:cytochrome c1 2, heme protein, mitochondrial-like [Oryza brachyantha]|uniref:Cytochrome c domain-containing protein n=1 Tax=Oryza brachyantha TaxID=4533 RepID=J3LIA4_ORYBR|nr:cytochrome c1 2, heme protein, mitochondrial-like [Oryza brachyantha]
MAATAGAAGCTAYPWPRDGAQRGGKVFMQSDCTACHGGAMFSASDDGAARAAAWEPKAVEIVVFDFEEVQPAATLNGGAYPPDLTLVSKGLRGNLYAAGGGAAAACQELRKRTLGSLVWL